MLARFTAASAGIYSKLGDWVHTLAVVQVTLHCALLTSNILVEQSENLLFRLIAIAVMIPYCLPDRFLSRSVSKSLRSFALLAVTISAPAFLLAGLVLELSMSDPQMLVVIRRQYELIGAIGLILLVSTDVLISIGVLIAVLAPTGLILTLLLEPDFSYFQPSWLTITSSYLLLIFWAFYTANRQTHEKQGKIETLENIGATLAHELRTPLLAIKAQALALKERSSSAKNTPSFVNIAEAIDKETNAASTLIDIFVINAGIQTWNQYETTQYFEVGETTRIALSRFPFRSSLEADSTKTTVKKSAVIRGSQTLFTHVIFNLIKNSLNHIANGRKPRINISVDVINDHMVLTHTDHGIGIPADALPNIFTPFYSSKKEIGSGIGLAFCKTTVEEHFGGTIECKSEPNAYTEFTIKIPIDKPEGN